MPVKALMISSVMPSLKYSASLSALMLRNGSTAIEASAGPAPDVTPEGGAEGSPCQASRANARSRAFWNRSPGSFSRQCETIRAELGRDLRARVPRHRILLEDGEHGLGRALPMEGAPPGQHLEEDRPEGEEVRAVVDRPPAHLLRRHIPGRAEDDARLSAGRRRLRQIRVLRRPRRQHREAEVEDLDDAFPRQKDVFGLEIAMHDAPVVRRGEAAGDLEGVLDGLARRDRRRGEAAAQRLALEQLHDRVDRSVGLADVVDPQDVGVGKRRHRARFAVEAPRASGLRPSDSGSTLIATSRPRRVSLAR